MVFQMFRPAEVSTAVHFKIPSVLAPVMIGVVVAVGSGRMVRKESAAVSLKVLFKTNGAESDR